VDDNEIVKSHPEEQYPMIMAMGMQGAFDTWDGGIGATWGASEPSNTFLSFVWEHGCWQYATINETPANVSLLDAMVRWVTLERFEVNESNKTEGVETAPGGNSENEFQRMRNLTEGWQDKIIASHLKNMDTWQTRYTTIWKSLE
jgi:hypothetical protein